MALVDKLILPGVGSFDTGMKKLEEKKLKEAIRAFALDERKPVLGICLGMQLLGRKSEEGKEAGLSLIPFESKRFRLDHNPGLKIPHMGWNIVKIEKTGDPLADTLDGIQRYYFVHSYHAVCDDFEQVLMSCEYGYSFTAAVKHNNIYGVQFHPEKSHKFGMALLVNFAKRV